MQWRLYCVVQRFFMEEPKQKAEELITHFIQMMPEGLDRIGYELKTQYEVAKCQAEYTAMTVKHSCKNEGKKYKYWLEVQNQIKLL